MSLINIYAVAVIDARFAVNVVDEHLFSDRYRCTFSVNVVYDLVTVVDTHCLINVINKHY